MNQLCAAMSLEPSLLMNRSKTLLKIYRSLASVTIFKADMSVRESSTLYIGEGSFIQDISVGLSYLADFEPNNRKKDFEAKIADLFETQWMIELMHHAMQRVRGFLDRGEWYYEILLRSYFDKQSYSNSELLELLELERTTFYEYKKEAILLFGIYLWGRGIPELYRTSSSAV
jgi:hypothetical protein